MALPRKGKPEKWKKNKTKFFIYKHLDSKVYVDLCFKSQVLI